MQFVMVANLKPGAKQSGGCTDFQQLLKDEKAHTRSAYMEGAIRQVWLQSPGPGAIAILEAESPEQAQKIAMQLPLAQAGLLDVSVIGLMPFDGFGAP
jgi:hypothetical protein